MYKVMSECVWIVEPNLIEKDTSLYRHQVNSKVRGLVIEGYR